MADSPNNSTTHIIINARETTLGQSHPARRDSVEPPSSSQVRYLHYGVPATKRPARPRRPDTEGYTSTTESSDQTLVSHRPVTIPGVANPNTRSRQPQYEKSPTSIPGSALICNAKRGRPPTFTTESRAKTFATDYQRLPPVACCYRVLLFPDCGMLGGINKKKEVTYVRKRSNRLAGVQL